MSALKDILRIILGLSAVGLLMWLYLKLVSLLEEGTERVFGRSWRSLRAPRQQPGKIEIQSLFHGNTKDQDQL